MVIDVSPYRDRDRDRFAIGGLPTIQRFVCFLNNRGIKCLPRYELIPYLSEGRCSVQTQPLTRAAVVRRAVRWAMAPVAKNKNPDPNRPGFSTYLALSTKYTLEAVAIRLNHAVGNHAAGFLDVGRRVFGEALQPHEHSTE